MWNHDVWPSSFQSNGERIYFTGTSESGQPVILRQGGGMHMRMMGGGCVTCHGADRQGRRFIPHSWTSAPALTPEALFNNQALSAKRHSHDDHGVYTDETLARSITAGIDPNGKTLDMAMPRWSMSEQDLIDLVAYLKTPPWKQ